MLAAWGATLGAPALAHASGALHTDGAALRDASGAVVVLRGVNVAGNAKVPDFRPITRAELLDPLPRWGMNAVRLLFTWEAYEPTSGAYDASYLDYVASVVAAARDRGLHVIVDFHQDAFARTALGGCGEGFPAWTLPPTVTPAAPDNGPTCSNWGTRMVFDGDQKKIWDSFYADTTGARTRYLAMLGRVAGRFAGDSAVVGYDMLNEPGGDEPTQIGPLYEDAAKALRSADPAAILFVSPQALTSSGGQTKLARPAFTNFVYSPHFYDSGVVLFKRWGGQLPDASFKDMRSKSSEWGAPLLLGEFGAPATTDQGPAYVRALYDELDATFASGTQWAYTPGWTDAAKDGWNTEDFSIVLGTGALRATYSPRAYAPRIAGAPVSLVVHEDGASSTIDLTWDHDPKAGETVLFVPDVELFGAHAVDIDAVGTALACAFAARHVTCTAPAAGRMRVTVRAGALGAGADGGAPGIPPSGTTPSGTTPPPPDSGKCGLFGIEALLPFALSSFLRRSRRKRE